MRGLLPKWLRDEVEDKDESVANDLLCPRENAFYASSLKSDGFNTGPFKSFKKFHNKRI